LATLNQVIRGCRKPLQSSSASPALDKCPQRKGICVKIFAVKPKKPNSAQRQVGDSICVTNMNNLFELRWLESN
jgi:small subunit ribosomal protein S12